MPTYALNDIFQREENRIGEKIFRRSLNKSVWNKLVPKQEWPNGMGDSIQAITIERNLPDDTDTWEDVVTSGSGDCVPTEYEVPSGSTARSYSLTQKALTSEDVCVDTTRGAFKVQEQTRLMFRNLTRAVAYVWKRRALLDYADLSHHKMIATHGLPENKWFFPSIEATSLLTQRMLNKIYMNLIHDSAEEDGGSLGMSAGRPQFILITDADSSDRIMEETRNTNAFLESDRVPELLQPLGVDRAIRGFYHVIDNICPRYNFTGGAWVEVPPYESASASKGTKHVISDEYRAATHTDSYVFLPSVMNFMVPRPISSIGSKTKWNPQAYMGDFKWLNIIHRTDNPLGQIGLYYALMQAASKPCYPDFGYVIRHARCPADIDHTVCDETADNASDEALGVSDSFFVV
jgi:hypothetical protein